MGILNLFSQKSDKDSGLLRLPSGSFTVDRTGKIVTSTLPRTFPEAQVKEIAELVLAAFRGAQDLQLPLTDLAVHYAALKLTAHEMRGGAIIFLAPRSLS